MSEFLVIQNQIEEGDYILWAVLDTKEQGEREFSILAAAFPEKRFALVQIIKDTEDAK